MGDTPELSLQVSRFLRQAIRAMEEVAHLNRRIEEMNAVLGKIRRTVRLPEDLYAEIDGVMIAESR